MEYRLKNVTECAEYISKYKNTNQVETYRNIFTKHIYIIIFSNIFCRFFLY